MEELEHNIADSTENTYRLLHERIDSFNYLIDDISMLAKSDQGELELNKKTLISQSLFQASYGSTLR